MRYSLLVFFLFTILSCSTRKSFISYKTDRLEIEPLTKNTYIHRSFLETTSWGKVPCNGLVYVNKGEALIFDTPSDSAASSELISLIENKMHARIKAVVINHFHDDCLGGLNVFHEHGIESYASTRTLKFALADTVNSPVIPGNGFEEELVLNIGNKRVLNKFFGEGHTKDNIVSYIPSEKVMFGGCLIKEIGAGKGNLADANILEWANSVRKVKNECGDVRFVVPGHGKPGDASLLDYTIQLFENKHVTAE